MIWMTWSLKSTGTFFNSKFFLNRFPTCFNLFVFVFPVTPFLLVIFQPCMEWTPNFKKNRYRIHNGLLWNAFPENIQKGKLTWFGCKWMGVTPLIFSDQSDCEDSLRLLFLCRWLVRYVISLIWYVLQFLRFQPSNFVLYYRGWEGSG